MARIFLARHGDTSANSRARYWGSTDVPLSNTGRAQAASLSARFAGETLTAIYTSDLQRAADTAAAIAARHSLQTEPCPELREIDFGELEGLTYEEIDERYPEVADRWRRRAADLNYPGGDSLTSFEKRVNSFQRRLAELPEAANVVVVAHSGVLRTLSCRLLGLDTAFRWQFQLDLAAVSIIETYPEGGIISLWNDTSHLKEVGHSGD